MKLEDLKPAPYNQNLRHIKARALHGLRYSLEEFGDISGIVWNEQSGNLVCGHQRVSALSGVGAAFEDGGFLLNGSRFEVRVVDWPEDKEQEANVAANIRTIQGEFDDDELNKALAKAAEENEAFAAAILYDDYTLPDEEEISSSDVDPEEEWEGMPEYKNEDKRAFRSLVVHFHDEEALSKFSEAVGCSLTDKTKYIWYPKIIIEKYMDKEYAAGDEP